MAITTENETATDADTDGAANANAVVPRETLTRESVVAAARAQIVEKGLESLSLRQVGASLGVTAPALYAYVTGKRDLQRAVAESAFEDLLRRFDKIEVRDPVGRLRELSRAYVGFAVDHRELFRTMFLFPPELDFGGPTGEELPLATQAFNYAIDAIRTAQASGAIRADLDPLVVSFTTWTATHGLATVLTLGFDFDQATKDLLTETLLDTVITGLHPT